MQKRYTLSGVLYHLPSQQILLHQVKSDKDKSLWTVVEGEGEDADVSKMFKELIIKNYRISLEDKDIYSVYDYISKQTNKIHYVYYGLINNINLVKAENNELLSWFTFKKANKLKFLEQVHHDIIITQRVINAHSSEAPRVERPAVNQ